ncbi:hypothetical protein AJ78_08598 [Emergomyces pasteurianus Ep9510]|uniref:Uncharacterized protein n=1 Tax=Emergomyces pasteurianus Ep9510 TaxID=1447872 RepID=A0A1J9P3B2_9EURO|nr:hypothetical protein AJ78_08598 [Emergomyces pasteurianus Ep9510]
MAAQVRPLTQGHHSREVDDHPAPRVLRLPAEIHEMIFTEISRAARDVQSAQEWKGLVGNCLCVNWFWNESLTNKLLKNCDVEVFLAYANETITEKAVERWIDQVSEKTIADPQKWEDMDSDDHSWSDPGPGTRYISPPSPRSSSPQILSQLLEQKLCLCLLLAASRGILHCLRALSNISVSLGVSIANTSFHSTTYLQESVRSGKLGVVSLLLDRGVDPCCWSLDIPDWGMLPISMAVQRLRVDIAAAILAYNSMPDQGRVPFRDDDSADGAHHVDDIDYWCVPGRESDWRLERLRYEVDPENDVVARIGEFGFAGCQYLESVSWAAYRSSLPMLKLLVERYSFLVDLERDLYWAFRGGGNVDVVRFLLQHGRCGTVAAPARTEGSRPGRYRAPAMKSQGPGTGSIGIRGSAFARSCPQEPAFRERVPVIDAVRYCDVGMVRLLLDTLPDAEAVSRAVNELDMSCMAPLQYAVRKRDEIMATYLLGCGAEIWQSCFDFVMTEGSSDMIELFSQWIKEHDLEVKKE